MSEVIDIPKVIPIIPLDEIRKGRLSPSEMDDQVKFRKQIEGAEKEIQEIRKIRSHVLLRRFRRAVYDFWNMLQIESYHGANVEYTVIVEMQTKYYDESWAKEKVFKELQELVARKVEESKSCLIPSSQ
jgi:hypothetical protein